MTDEALARALAAAFAGVNEGHPNAESEFHDYSEHWLRVAAMARTILALEKP